MRRARHTVTLVTPPVIEPVSLAETKAWIRIDDPNEDILIIGLITTARMSAEEHLRRAIISQTFMLTLDLVGNDLYHRLGEGTYDIPLMALYGALPPNVELPKGPIQSIAGVITYALDNTSSIYDPSNYYLDNTGERLVLSFGKIWPANLRPIHAAEITYISGYGNAASNVPQPIRNGIKMHVASLYEERGQSADAMAIPAGALQLYNQYRIMGKR